MNKILIGLLVMPVIGGIAFYMSSNLIESRNQEKIDHCITEVDTAYSKEWKATCKEKGEADNCKLDAITAASLNAEKTGGESMCIQRYK